MFRYPQQVRFRHCDPAGIVFFPRYFEMMNDCMEAFFADVLKAPFEHIHRTGGVPTARIATRFVTPGRHGDRLVLSLRVKRVGRTSFGYEMTAHCGDEMRFETTGTLVHVNSAGRPAPWPADLRARLAAQQDLPA